MKIVIIATEASSDFLGFNLIKSLKRKKKNKYTGCWWTSNGKCWIKIMDSNKRI